MHDSGAMCRENVMLCLLIESRLSIHVVPALRRDPRVSAIALIAMPCALVSAVEQTPSALNNARGWVPAQGRDDDENGAARL